MTDKRETSNGINDLDPARLLASPRLAQWVMGALVVVALSVLMPLVIGGPGAGEAAQRLASGSAPLLALYILLAGSLLTCMIRRLRGVARRVSVDPKPRRTPTAQTVSIPVTFQADRAAEVLRRAGYRSVSEGEGWAWGVKHRWSPIGTVLLHSAVLLGLVGAAVATIPGVNRVEHSRVLVGEADQLPLGGGSVTLTQLNATPGARNTLRSLQGTLRTDGGRTIRLRPDLPAFIGPVTAAVLEDFDVSASFSVVPTGALQPSTEKTAALRLRKANSVDRMTISADDLGTYRLTVRMDQGNRNAVVARVERREKGNAEAQWRLVHAGREMARGDIVRVGKARLRFDGLSRWAILRVHRAPSTPIILAALIAAVIGASMRLLVPRAEATILATQHGCSATVAVDAYRGSRTASAALAEDMGRWE